MTRKYVDRGSDEERVLVAVHDVGGLALPAAIETATGLDDASVIYAGDELKRLGLAEADVSAGGEIILTPRGKHEVREVLRSRHSGPDRRDAVQIAVLRYLGDSDQVQSFLRAESSVVDGMTVTKQELDDAISELEDLAMVKVTRDWHESPIVAWVEPRGRNALAEGSVIDYLATAGGAKPTITNDHSLTVNAASNTGVVNAVGGQDNQVTFTQTISSEVRSQIINTVEEALDGLEEAPENDIVRADLVAVKESAKDPSTSKESLKDKIVEAVTTAAATVATQHAVLGLVSLFPLLG